MGCTKMYTHWSLFKDLCTVLCGMFSPLDSDIVFTGSADHSVHAWRLSKDLHNTSIDFKSK